MVAEVMGIPNMPVGRFGKIIPGQGKGAGKIGFRTHSCFFLIEDPSIDWLATSPLLVELLPEFTNYCLPRRGNEDANYCKSSS